MEAPTRPRGFGRVSYPGGKDVRIKGQITKTGGPPYTYNLNNKGTAETFPLTEGDGKYTVKVFENTRGTKYAQAYSCSLDLKLTSEFSPSSIPTSTSPSATTPRWWPRPPS